MIRSSVLLVLLAVIAALGGWIYLHPQGKTATPLHLSALTPGAAREVRIEVPGKPLVVLEKRAAGWQLTAPYSARAETHLVEEILSILDATPRAQLPPQDLARFGLAQPHERITIDGRDFALGAVNPITSEVYVLHANRVYVLSPRYAAMPSEADSLISHSILASTEVPVRFTFPQFEVKLQNGIWQLKPGNGNLSEDDLVRWVDAWRSASALRVEPDAGPATPTAVDIELRDGRHVAVGVTERDGELVLTRFDEHVHYYLFANSARRLLAAPGTPPPHGPAQ